MRAARLTFGVLAATAMAHVSAQTPYPDLTLQDMAWSSGTHHYGVTQKILSPSTPALPMDISGTADVEFVSGTEVRLRPGFHAGSLSGNGRFRARIDQTLGPVGDVIIISPAPDGSEPYGSIVDNVIHVHKWEKVEVGLRLPQEYQDAIDRFFRHYYRYNYPPYPPVNSLTNVATPSNVDNEHDLNPYADDSLQLVMTLTRPDGSQTMKWGFFMKEGKWASTWDGAKPAVDPAAALYPYHVRFRFALDKEGPWGINLSVKAPHTLSLANAGLPDLTYSGLALHCDPPLPDNNGHLRVNQANRRVLEFEGDEDDPDDQTPYFGLGVNMADVRNRHWDDGPSDHDYGLQRRDFRFMRQSMEQLHDAGGNFMRLWMFRNIFNVEWVNTGVYDAFRTPQVCDQSVVPPWPNCNNGGWTTDYLGNCQAHTWALDSLLLVARANNIYVQLCIDAHPPIINYERYHWGANPYVSRFLEPHRLPHPSDNPLDMKRFFFTPNTPLTSPENVFYWWKRKYKYIMSRWGWSVNVPIIEPFNEIDQMPSYRRNDLRAISCNQHGGMCYENRVVWEEDTVLPIAYNDWLTEIISYVKDPVDQSDPSSLGESKKLFITGTGLGHSGGANHYLPHQNPRVDLGDVHYGFFPNLAIERNMVDWRNHEGWQHAQACMASFPDKPINQGEYTHYTNFTIPNPAGGDPLWSDDVEMIFHNYDVSFHNEIWTSAFSGKFAAGTSWQWNRVFWWEDALPEPPEDPDNTEQPNGQFTNILGALNLLYIGIPNQPCSLVTKRLHHHFQPLADLLNRPSVRELGIFSDAFTPDKFFDDEDADGINPLEAYYLRGDLSTAIGWVHNRNASVAKSFYVKSGASYENFLGCTAPAAASIRLSGFFPLHAHYITWFPTRIGATDLPPDTEFPNTLQSDANGDIVINLDGEFNGVVNNYLDTLHADYAFVITPEPFVKSLARDTVEAEPEAGWDFWLYPNPTRDGAWLRLKDDSPRTIEVLDALGRTIVNRVNVADITHYLDMTEAAKGLYWVRVSSGGTMKTRKLLIH